MIQEIPIVNNGDAPISVAAHVKGKGFSGPKDLPVPVGGIVGYPLKFHPPTSGIFQGQLELTIPTTGEKNIYNLQAKGGEPLAEGHIIVDCQAK
jgi:hypothetical protein